MLHFHIWCNLKGGEDEEQFCESVQEFLSYLHERELIEGYQIARRQFVIAPPDLGKFHIMVEFADLAQLNRSFDYVADKRDEVAAFHQSVTGAVRNLSTALYKDFPEPKRRRG
jgi:hypothetical protein